MHKKIPSIPEISRAADVSTATVDRVLNNRGGVREKTRAKVQHAIDQLQRGDANMRGKVARPASARIAFVINSSPSFSKGMTAVVKSVAAEMGLDPMPSVHIHSFVDSRGLDERLSELIEGTDGFVLIGRSSYLVDQVVDRIVASGRPVVVATTNFPDARPTCYIGMNQIAAGRLAGRLLGEMFRGSGAPILMHIGRRSRTEDEREMGFRALIREHFAEIELREMFNKSATDEEAEALLDAELQSGSAPCAIFTTGGGLQGLARRLSMLPQGQSRPFLLGYELLPSSEQLLRDGSVDCLVAANSRQIVEQALQATLDVAVHGKTVHDMIHAPNLIFRENLDCFNWY